MAFTNYDDMHFAQSLRTEAVPALERLAHFANIGEQTNRNYDEIPEYCSSTEEEDLDDLHPADQAEADEMLEAPLQDYEFEHILNHMAYRPRACRPNIQYDAEVDREFARIKRWGRTEASPKLAAYVETYGSGRATRASDERVRIIARHNVRRKWERLGAWNPDWQSSCEYSQAHGQPDSSTWLWPWENKTQSKPGNPHLQASMISTLESRRGLRRSEYVPIQPDTSLDEDTSKSHNQSFIMSRPWYGFGVEMLEEGERCSRLSTTRRYFYGDSSTKQVEKRWKANNVWKETWRLHNDRTHVGWRWPHEESSPEPEDLCRLDNISTYGLSTSDLKALDMTFQVRSSSSNSDIPVLHGQDDRPRTFNSLQSLTPDLSPPNSAAAGASHPSAIVGKRKRSKAFQHSKARVQPLRRSARIAALANAQPLISRGVQKQSKNTKTQLKDAKKGSAQRNERDVPSESQDVSRTRRGVNNARIKSIVSHDNTRKKRQS